MGQPNPWTTLAFINKFHRDKLASRYNCAQNCTRVVECISSKCFIKRSMVVVSVLVGPCCPALLHCIDVDVPTVVLLGK